MPWASVVPAILEGHLGGQAGAGGVANILYGVVNPSGKLAETFPIRVEDNPSYHYFPGGPATVEYRESIYVGYRYYDTVTQDVLYPFGHGLSYTTFEYSDLQLGQERITDTDDLSVTLKVKNTGVVVGKEVVQVYVRDEESTAFRPEKELKGFAKVKLQPGEEAAVAVTLNRRSFAYYNTELQDWHVESGSFEILVGSSSSDIRLNAKIEVISAQPTAPAVDEERLAVYYNFPIGNELDVSEFEALLGRPVPPNQGPQKGAYTINTPLGDMGDSFIARQLQRMIKKQMAKMIEGMEDTPVALLMEAMAKEMPLRSMLMLGGGSLTREMLDALLVMINGKFLRGAGALIKAARAR